MKLSASLITELSTLRANIAALRAEEEELTIKVKKLLKDEGLREYAPKESPLKFVWSKFERAQVKWKNEWFKLAREKWGSHTAKKKAHKISDDSKKPGDCLNIEGNENYAA